MNRLCVKQYKRIGPVEWMKLNEIEWRVEKSTTKKPLKPKNEARKSEKNVSTVFIYLISELGAFESTHNWKPCIYNSFVDIHTRFGSYTHHFSIRFVLQTVEFCVSLCSSRLTALIIKWIKFSAYEKRIKDVIWKKAAHKSSPHALHIRMKGGREKENWCEC